MRSSTAPLLLLLLVVPTLPAPEFQPELWTAGAVAGPRSPWLQPLAGLMAEIFRDPVPDAVRLRQTAGERAVVDWLAGLQADQVRDQLTAQWERLPTESRQNLAGMVGLLQEKLQQGWGATTDNLKHSAQLLIQYLYLAFTELLKIESFLELLVQNLASLPQETVEELLGLVPWSEITDVVYNFHEMTLLDLRELVLALQPLYTRLLELYSLQDLQHLLQQAAASQTKQAEAALLLSAGGALETLQELGALIPWHQVFFMLKNYEDSTISDQLQLVSSFQPLYQHLTDILASDQLMMFLHQFLASSAEVESFDMGSGDGGGDVSLVEFLTELNALVPWQEITLTWQSFPRITMSDLQELALEFQPLIERIAEFLTPQNLRVMFSLDQVDRMETINTAEAVLLLRAGGALQTAQELNALVPWQLIFSTLENYENNTISELQQLALAFEPLYERLTELFIMQDVIIFLEQFIVSSEEVKKLDDGIVAGTAEANVVEMVTELSELIPWQLISQTFHNYPEVSLSELNQLALAFKPLYAHIGLELEKVERASGDDLADGETLSEIVAELYSLVPWEQISLVQSFSSITTADLRQLLASFKPLFERLTELFTLQDLQSILQHISFKLEDKEDEVVEAMDKMDAMEVASNGGLLAGLTSFLSSSFGRKSEDQFCQPARVVCYYPNWAAHRGTEGKFTVADIDSSLCTHIIYSFVVLHPDKLVIISDDPQLDLELGNFQNFTALKRTNPGVKYMVALGGWADSQDPKYSRLLASSVHMDTFVAHAVQFLQEFGFDGLDLDYEYPGYDGHGHDAPDSDRPGLVQLCRKLRAAFRPHGWELTAAVAAPTSIVDTAYDIPQLSQLLDAVHLMAYDMHGSWESATNHHAALHGSAWDKLTAEAAAAHWVAKGCPAYKLVVGIPTYGRSWTLASWASHQGVEAPAVGAGQAGPITKAGGYLAYSEICQFIQNQGWTVLQDPTNHIGPIAYSGDQWVGYDDPAMSAVKAGWALEQQYGGTMFWDLPSDDFRGDCGAGRFPVIRAAADLVLGQQVCS